MGKRAWKNGCAEAGEVYALHLSNGIYCPKDTALAIKLYRKAVKAGSGSAAHNLGIEYRDMGKYKKAFALYKKADELGGDISVGLCYYYGVGVARDKLKAFYFFKTLLKRNICLSSYDTNEANYLIGKMYLQCEVVKRSVSKARHYLLLANEDDDHISASELLAIIGLYDRPK